MQALNETETRIVEAATVVFLEKGIAGARTQTIADLAGINKALLHYYFRTKDKLYDVVAERVIRSVFDSLLQKVAVVAPFEQWLPNFVHQYMSTISGNQTVLRFMLWEIEAGGGRIAEVVKTVLGAEEITANPIYKVVNKAVQDKKIRPIDPVQFVITLLACCIFPYIARPILEKLMPGLDIRSRKFQAEREKAILDLFWNGLKQESGCPDGNSSNTQYSKAWMPW